MLARTPLRDQMIAWLETQDPDTRYEWRDPTFCACAQFARATGHIDEWLMGPMVHMREWSYLNEAACYGPRTFGALLQRLRGTS